MPPKSPDDGLESNAHVDRARDPNSHTDKAQSRLGGVMDSQQNNDWDQATLAIRCGHERTEFGEHSEPIILSSSFVFNSAKEAAARFSGESEGYIYSRFSNPTVAAFQTRLAALEGGEACIATASGMSAIMATVLTLLSSGDHIVASKSMFGSTVNLFQKILPRFGIDVTWVPIVDSNAWQSAIRDNTKMFFLETPTNPMTEVADIKTLSEIAHARDIFLVVDNCFCTPALQRPLLLGADLVIHSATKFIDGQGRCIGGAIVGPANILEDALLSYMRSAGPSMSPFNAWVFLKGLETLDLRMKQHCESAGTIAKWLHSHPEIQTVNYPGLPEHPQHLLATQQQTGYGAVMSFEVAGGQARAWRLIDSLRLMSITANLGDAKTTITHPATTTHARVKEADRKSTGITPSLVRISVGLESCADLLQDLEHGLNASG